MTSKKEHEEIVRKVHEERGWEQPFRVIVDDDIGNPRYQLAACDHCGREFTFVLDADRYRSWKDRRMLVQAAMPGIAPADREILMTHTCGECWDRLFGSPNRKRKGRGGLLSRSEKKELPMPRVGEDYRTPRFLCVTIRESFDSLAEAYKAGYTETTHNVEGYEVGGFKVLGKHLGNNRMHFAVARVTARDFGQW